MGKIPSNKEVSGLKAFTKKTWLIVALVLAMIVMTACGSGNSGNGGNSSSQSGSGGNSAAQKQGSENTDKKPVTLTFMVTNENYSDRLKDFIANYEQMSGNKVEVQLLPSIEYNNMLRVKMMADEGPDLFVTDDIVADQFAKPQEWFEDLSNRPWVSRLSDSGRKMIEWNDGRITGLPIINPGGFGILYNKDIFAQVGITELPQTWDEFLAVSEKIKQAGITPVNIQLANGSEFGTTHLMHQLFVNVEFTRDANQLISDLNENRVKLADVDEFRQALHYMLELKEKGYINEDFISTTLEISHDKFGNGEVAMHPTGDFFLSGLQSKFPDEYPNMNLGFFTIPFGDSPGAIALYSGVGVSVNAKAKNKEAALEFIDFFASKEQQEAYMAKGPGTTIFADVQTDANPISRDLAVYMDQGRTFMGLFARLAPWDDLHARKLMQELMLGALTVDGFLQGMDEQMKMIAESKQLPGW
jgi:ABC-type glycerol-3-phosphate transport system substrate-binding protein